MDGNILLNKLQEVGINLLPLWEHAMYLGIDAKENDVENKCLLEVISLVRGFGIKSSINNLE